MLTSPSSETPFRALALRRPGHPSNERLQPGARVVPTAGTIGLRERGREVAGNRVCQFCQTDAVNDTIAAVILHGASERLRHVDHLQGPGTACEGQVGWGGGDQGRGVEPEGRLHGRGILAQDKALLDGRVDCPVAGGRAEGGGLGLRGGEGGVAGCVDAAGEGVAVGAGGGWVGLGGSESG